MDNASTLNEYLSRETELAAQARTLFPFDFSECSYNKGYVKQQLYACLDCYEADSNHAGLCYSCSIACHGEHTLVELFDRRSFRCDCGTPRLRFPCSLKQPVTAVNDENSYNDNFHNIFCYCCMTYDPVNEAGTMFQCIICEDWFHDRCISEKEALPNEEQFSEYICRRCTTANSWLLRYRQVPGVSAQLSTDSLGIEETNKRKATDAIDPRPTKRSSSCSEDCMWSALLSFDSDTQCSLFLVDGFRDGLCHCDSCQERMARLPALLEEEEVFEPPTDGDSSQDETDANHVLESVLASMPREKAIEGVLALGSLKEQIVSYLRPLAERGEIVTKEHVEQFFEQKKKT